MDGRTDGQTDRQTDAREKQYVSRPWRGKAYWRKLRNGVRLSLFACFQNEVLTFNFVPLDWRCRITGRIYDNNNNNNDGRQNNTESYIVNDSLYNVPQNICGGSVLVFDLLLFYFC